MQMFQQQRSDLSPFRDAGSSALSQLGTGFGATTDASTATTVIGRLQKLVALLGGGLPSALVSNRLDVNIGASSATVPISSATLATVAKQPALGTAGSSSADVISVQGIASGTPLIAIGQPAGTTDGLARDASISGLVVAQASTTSGQSGPLCQTATTTAAPTYTTAKTNPLSTTTAGALRTDSSATTQPVSIATAPIVTAGTTPTLTSVALTTTGAQVWAASAAAKARKLYNPTGNAVAYCIYYDGSNNVTSEATTQFVIQPGQVWEMPNYNGVVEYTGIVRCALASSTGNINATQVT